MNKEQNSFDPNRYTIQKNTGPQDPRALYVTFRLDQHATDPVHVKAVRAAILEHLIPAIEDHNPSYAAGLKETIEALSQLDFTFPENGTRQAIPKVNAVYLKQGAGFHVIMGLSVDDRTDDIMVHTRSTTASNNMMATLVPLTEFFEVEAADGVKQRTWQEVDPETGEPITPPLVQVLAPVITNESTSEDTEPLIGDDEDTNPNAEPASNEATADEAGESTDVEGSDGGALPEADQESDGDGASDEGQEASGDDEANNIERFNASASGGNPHFYQG